mmetsp:Transcript_7623/g.14196  ORF Transcript_7623/g.14196 Transcript_7623/m.14196 type:complete len:238 (+) Transcript_7623:392-1105(+)
MCIMAQIAQEPMKRRDLSQHGIRPQAVFCRYTWESRSSSCTASRTSLSSSRSSWNSSSCSRLTACRYMPATTMEPSWPTPEATIMIVEIFEFIAARSSFPFFCAKPDSRVYEAANTTGMMRNSTGLMPISIEQTGTLSIEQITAVGQSGPPTRTATLGVVKPGVVKTIAAALIVGVCVPTIILIWTLSAYGSPTNFIRTTFDDNLMTQQSADASDTPYMNGMSSALHRCTTTMPATR